MKPRTLWIAIPLLALTACADTPPTEPAGDLRLDVDKPAFTVDGAETSYKTFR